MRRKFLPMQTDVIRLDIGCGNIKSPEWTGIDIADFGQAIVWDIRQGIPFPNDSVSWVRMNHFLEHLTRREHCGLFEELRRVCKPKSEISIVTPHSSVMEADYPGHLSYWDERRVEGIVNGFRTYFEIVSNKREGGELHAILKVL